MRKVCCNTSVGVLISDGPRHLLLTRPDGKGVAPVAGHVLDEHSSYEDAARAEAREEVGLTVTALTPVTGGWRANRCGRAPGPRGHGHDWRVFLATEWSGAVVPSRRETRAVDWYGPAELQDLANRTCTAAQGRTTRHAWEDDPGLEGVWCRWLADAGLITLSEAQLAAIEAFAELGVPR
jgi:8-oxo-dGTP pyrophosphatase MutT (NUDIX family)